MRRLITLLLLALSIAGCSAGGKKPTAPAPDNPTPPIVTGTADWPATPSTITLLAPSEDLVVDQVSLNVSHPPDGGGVDLLTDLVGESVLHAGVPMVVHVTTYAMSTKPYVWQSGDDHVVRTTVHRPGQRKQFFIELIRD